MGSGTEDDEQDHRPPEPGRVLHVSGGKCRYLSAEVRQRRRLSRQSLLQSGGGTEENRKALLEAEELGSKAQKNANDNVVKTLENQQTALKADAANLEQLQAKAQSSQGRMEAIQYANQLASHQSNQLLQLRGLLMAQIAAENARDQTVAAREARQQATREVIWESRYKKSSGTVW